MPSLFNATKRIIINIAIMWFKASKPRMASRHEPITYWPTKFPSAMRHIKVRFK